MIRIENITKKYKSKKDVVVTALDNLSVEVDGCGLLFIVGRSGCGKTTLLNAIGGLDRLDSGSIFVDGEDICKLSDVELNKYRGEKVGFVFQEYNLIDHFTAWENIILSQKVLGVEPDVENAKRLMLELGIDDLKDRRADELSGGQRQRVAIVRALVKSPTIILADEPTGALDEESGEDLIKLLKQISKETLVLVVSHDKDTAYKYGDRVIELASGRIKDDIKNNKDSLERKTQKQIETKLDTKGKGLAVKEAFSIGFRGVFRRKIRLVLSILTTSLTLLLFVFSLSLATYDETEIYLDLMYKENNYFFNVTQLSMAEPLQNGHLSYIRQKLNREKLYLSYEMADVGLRGDFYDLPELDFYNYDYMLGYMETSKDLLDDFHFGLLAGRLPTNDDEIALTEYYFEYFRIADYYDSTTDSALPVENYSDMLGKTIISNYKVVGIVDTNYNFDKYSILMDKDADRKSESYLNIEYANSSLLGNYSAHSLIFVNEGFFGRNEYKKIFAAAVPLSGNPKKDARLIETFNPDSLFSHGEMYLIHDNNIAVGVFDVNRDLTYISTFLTITTIVFAALAFLMLLSFFAAVFADEERTVHILRALGANLKSIFLIFFLLPLTLSLLNITIASVASVLVAGVVNKKLHLVFHIDFSIVNFSFLSISLMILLSLVTALLSALVPLKKHSLL